MHTIREFLADGRESYIVTHCGVYRVAYVNWPETNPWAVTPEANGGFGSSWCVHYGTPLYATRAEATAARDAERARLAARKAVQS